MMIPLIPITQFNPFFPVVSDVSTPIKYLPTLLNAEPLPSPSLLSRVKFPKGVIVFIALVIVGLLMAWLYIDFSKGVREQKRKEKAKIANEDNYQKDLQERLAQNEQAQEQQRAFIADFRGHIGEYEALRQKNALLLAADANNQKAIAWDVKLGNMIAVMHLNIEKAERLIAELQARKEAPEKAEH